jgi:hypothetical protein
VLACWYPASNFDIWVHLAVGRDVFLSGDMPTLDAYSWTASGRPFTAHEWLSGLIFYLIGTPTDGAALTVLRAWFAALIVVCAWLALPKAQRRAPPVALLVALALFVVLSRALVRPHLFSLLFAGLLLVGFAWWRQYRRWRALLWAIPLTVVWANLHGAYMLCPVLLLAMGGGVFLSARFEALSPADAERPYVVKDALQPIVIGLACFGAAAVTPYGFKLFTFSTQMAGGNEYIKQMIAEWAAPLTVHIGLHDVWAFIALAILVALGLWRSRGTFSLPELLICLVTLVMALRAVRFMSYFALFALPVGARAWTAVWEGLHQRERAPRWAYGGALLVPVALIAWVLVAGPSLRQGANLPFATGFVRAGAADAAFRLHELGYTGGVFCEYEDGAYLVYAGRGKFKPVIDGRIDIYGERLTLLWVGARHDEGRINLYLDHFRVNAALLYPDRSRYDEMRQDLLGTGRWREEPHDGFTLFFRTTPLPS